MPGAMPEPNNLAPTLLAVTPPPRLVTWLGPAATVANTGDLRISALVMFNKRIRNAYGEPSRSHAFLTGNPLPPVMWEREFQSLHVVQRENRRSLKPKSPCYGAEMLVEVSLKKGARVGEFRRTKEGHPWQLR